jgi:hypothetical protein
MDATDLLAAVREDNATALDRLGSEKMLLAATEARLEPGPVMDTARAVVGHAGATLREWAETTAGPAAEALAAAADDLDRAHEDLTAASVDDAAAERDAEAVPLVHLDAAGPVERVGAGLVGLPLVLDCLFLQSVSFFVNEADAARSDLFRELRETADDLLDLGGETLAAVCADDDWERAGAAATRTVQAAYEEYVDRLDAMGFDPKPIC